MVPSLPYISSSVVFKQRYSLKSLLRLYGLKAGFKIQPSRTSQGSGRSMLQEIRSNGRVLTLPSLPYFIFLATIYPFDSSTLLTANANPSSLRFTGLSSLLTFIILPVDEPPQRRKSASICVAVKITMMIKQTIVVQPPIVVWYQSLPLNVNLTSFP